jgi:hypothetical protein
MCLTGEKYRLRGKYVKVIQQDIDLKGIVEYGIVVSDIKNFTREDGSSFVLAKCHITNGLKQDLLWISINDLKEMFEPSEQ